jgi:hypothetical protein
MGDARRRGISFGAASRYAGCPAGFGGQQAGTARVFGTDIVAVTGGSSAPRIVDRTIWLFSRVLEFCPRTQRHWGPGCGSSRKPPTRRGTEPVRQSCCRRSIEVLLEFVVCCPNWSTASRRKSETPHTVHRSTRPTDRLPTDRRPLVQVPDLCRCQGGDGDLFWR